MKSGETIKDVLIGPGSNDYGRKDAPQSGKELSAELAEGPVTKTPRLDRWTPLFKQLILTENNIRVKYSDIEELCYSIVAAGKVLKPLSVYRVKGTEYFIIRDGHRRYLAVKMAIELRLLNPDTFRIDVIVVDKETEVERLLNQLEANTGGQPNTFMEEALVYERLHAQGWSPEDIANKRRRSITHVANCFILLKAPAKLRQLVIDDVIAPTQVIKMLKSNTPEEVEKMVVDAYEDASLPGGFKALSSVDREYDSPARQDNTKYTGADTRELPEDSSEPKKIRLTAKNLKNDKVSRRYHETEVKNFVMSALLALSDWKTFSSNDKTTRDALVAQVEEWFQENKDASGGEKYF